MLRVVHDRPQAAQRAEKVAAVAAAAAAAAEEDVTDGLGGDGEQKRSKPNAERRRAAGGEALSKPHFLIPGGERVPFNPRLPSLDTKLLTHHRRATVGRAHLGPARTKEMSQPCLIHPHPDLFDPVRWPTRRSSPA